MFVEERSNYNAVILLNVDRNRSPNQGKIVKVSRFSLVTWVRPLYSGITPEMWVMALSLPRQRPYKHNEFNDNEESLVTITTNVVDLSSWITTL